MALLLSPFAAQPADWQRLFAAELPDLELRFWPDPGNRADIEAVAVTALPRGEFKTFPNLKLIVSLLAGADALLSDPELPKTIPIARAGRLDGDEMMSEVTLLHVLFHHRYMTAFKLAQQRAEWISMPRKRAGERTVGVMGLGLIGLAAARTLAGHGFKVAGWVRQPRKIDGIEVFAGASQFGAFLARSEIVVNLLPLTKETQDILDREAFAQMPKGAALVNLGRGGHVNEPDLIAALDSDHLAAASLDVFPVEPLPKDSPLWAHPKITITPHAARRIDVRDLVPRIAAAIRNVRAGKQPDSLIDVARGY
jgi:glyoxylate/hydroxypyruvate reductase A